MPKEQEWFVYFKLFNLDVQPNEIYQSYVTLKLRYCLTVISIDTVASYLMSDTQSPIIEIVFWNMTAISFYYE